MFVAFRIDTEMRKDEQAASNLFMSTCFNFFCPASKIGHEIYFFTCCGWTRVLPLAFDISLECLVQQIKTNSCDTFFYGSQYILRSQKMRARSKSSVSLARMGCQKSELHRKNKNLQHSFLKVDFSIYLASTVNPSSSFCLPLFHRFYESFNRQLEVHKDFFRDPWTSSRESEKERGRGVGIGLTDPPANDS